MASWPARAAARARRRGPPPSSQRSSVVASAIRARAMILALARKRSARVERVIMVA